MPSGVLHDAVPRLSGTHAGKDDTPENVIWFSVRTVIRKRLFFHKNGDLLISWNRTEMEKIAWLIGFDYEGEWRKICTTDLPVPKSWGAGIDAITLKPAGAAKPPAKKGAKKVPAKKAAKKAAKKTAKKAA